MGLVVKKGSKRWGRCSAAMPQPVSLIATWAMPSGPWLVVMVISPRSAMAWPALTSRFMNTWLSWEAMQYTWGRVGS